ncbi:MAG: hypothetical protein R2939_00175 [Kofleriaceae bacterium]
MAKLTGTVRRSDLAGGLWTLETDEGEHYQLTGEVAGLRDGLRAEVSGKVQRDQLGIGMVGPHFEVQRVRDLG